MTCNRAFSSLVLLGLVWLTSERTAFADDTAPVPAQRMGHVIYLEPVDPNGTEDENGGILQRELLRQAFLLAARASFGLATRDGSLRELPPDGLPGANRLRLTASFRPKAEISLTIECGQGDGRKVLWNGKAGPLKETPGDLLPLLEEAEALSRSGFV
ncbi:MAG TPA: hypothetical protein VGY58_16760, partial [Gemmataceae bacterium]|nr:hypothetical protein [Gemmataceae bacterium]